MAELRGDLVTLCPATDADAGALRRIHRTPEVSRWWGLPDDGFPMTDAPGTTRLTIFTDGAVAGLIQFREEEEPHDRSAWIDIYLDPAVHGRGLGTAAVRTLVRHLIDERGHHRVTIDPSADNLAAIRCYERAGFAHVGRMRLAEQGHLDGVWRDALLMELVEEPRAQRAPTAIEVAEACFRAYEIRDRDLLERHVADEFVFSSPADPELDRSGYFERCWPSADQIRSFQMDRVAAVGEQVWVTYDATRADGTRFRNTEVLTVRGGQVVRAEVYFGWNLA